MADPEEAPQLSEIIGRLRQPPVQLAILGGLLGVILVTVVLVDLATGGDTQPPPALGSSLQVTPGSRVVIVPTLLPIATPTPVIEVTPTVSSAADALARDSDRLRELALLQEALEEFRDRFDEYPDNEGSIQTMCAYKELDVGCDLKKVLSDEEEGLLEDPLGEPLANGYWYASDGKTYTIWMRREGAGNAGDPVCPEVIPHLKDKAPLFCITAGGSP